MEPLATTTAIADLADLQPYIPLLIGSGTGIGIFILCWALSDKAQRQRLIIIPLCGALWLESPAMVMAQGATATTASTATTDFPTITKVMEGVPVTLPDWSKITLDSLGGMTEAGNVTIPSEIAGDLGFDKVQWNVGDKLSDVLPMGALSDCLGLDKLTQNAVNAITGNVTNNLPLNKFGPINLQSLTSLTDAVPGLGNLKIGDVLPIKDLVEKAIGFAQSGQFPGLQDLLGQMGGLGNVTQIADAAGNILGAVQNGNVVDAAGQVLGALGTDGKVTNSLGEVTGIVNQAGQIVNQAGQILGTVKSVIQSPQALLQMPIQQLLQQLPQLGQLGLNNLDLSKYTFQQIPGLQDTPIGKFLDWQKVFANGIPGLGQVPFNKFPNPLAEGMDPFVARVDVPLDEKEAKHTNQKTVSGSYQQGFRVPCDKDCAQAELTPIAGSQMDKANMGAFANGKSWISGKHQQVEGGEGVLKMVNGGKEPTGRNPYCSVFKQVVTKVDAPGGKVGTSMYFRFCKRGTPDLGCTPYFLGPIPFLSYKEKQFIYLGDSNAKDDGGGIQVGGQDDPLSSQDGFNDCGSKLSGEATASATKAVEKVARSVNDGAFQQSSGKAKEHVERIMAEAQKQGITCPAQIAYLLATAGGESTYGANMGEFADTAMQSSGGTQYYGRGYVGLTHRENYAKATQYLKSQGMNVDLVANPNLASRPDIAAKVLVWGMKTGAFTGRKLGDYVKCDGRVDFSSARNVVNPGEGGARRSNMAKAAQIFHDALKDKDVAKDKASDDQCNAKPTESKPCPDGTSGKTCPLQNPLPNGVSTSEYGWRKGRMHEGLDISTGGGAKVLAAADGVVREYVPVGGKCGGIISVWHADRNLETRYLHMKKLLVSSGAKVTRGQAIGIEGNETPEVCSFGAHLHYEIRPGGGYSHTNPRNYAHTPALR